MDLDDLDWFPAAEAFAADAQDSLVPYMEEKALVAPFATDEISERA